MSKAEFNENSILDLIFNNQTFHLLIILLLSSLLLFANLNKGGLSGYDDAFYAHEAKQILITGDWWNIKFNGNLNFEFPPLFIWMEAISFSLLGVNDFAAKFPAALTGLLTIWVVFYLAKEISDEYWFPILSAWILMLSQYFLKYAMHAMTDVPFTLFFTLAIYFYLKGLRTSSYFILCGIALGAGILTRSVIGLIPVIIIITHLILTKQFKVFFNAQFLAGIALTFFIPSIWYLSQFQTHGESFINGHFSFIQSKVKTEKTKELITFLRGFAEYPWLLLKLYQPWFLLMLIGFAVHLKNAFKARNTFSILLILWVVFVIGAFSFAEAKVLRYIMAAFPAFALLAATPLNNWIKKINNKNILAISFAAMCFIVIMIVVFANPKYRAEEMIEISAQIDVHTPSNQRVVFYTGADLKHDFNNQILWYSNRFTEALKDESIFLDKLRSENQNTFVVDKATFKSLINYQSDSIQVIKETNNFVLFKN